MEPLRKIRDEMEKPPESTNPDESKPRERLHTTDASLRNRAADAGRDVNEKHKATAPLPERNRPSDFIDDQKGAVDVSSQSAAGKQEASLRNDGLNLDMILDIPLEITVELGRTQMPINELLQLVPGSAVSLSRLEGEPVDILANDRLIAKGIVLVKDEKYGIQITEITGRLKRLRGLR
jgi:flagellar motor switch protein FliN/FliY